MIIVDDVQRAANGKADYPWARGSRGPGQPRSLRERRDDASAAPVGRRPQWADRLDEVGVAVITGVLDPAATADVRARLLDAADRSDLVGIPTWGYAFDFDEKNRRVFMLFVWGMWCSPS